MVYQDHQMLGIAVIQAMPQRTVAQVYFQQGLNLPLKFYQENFQYTVLVLGASVIMVAEGEMGLEFIMAVLYLYLQKVETAW